VPAGSSVSASYAGCRYTSVASTAGAQPGRGDGDLTFGAGGSERQFAGRFRGALRVRERVGASSLRRLLTLAWLQCDARLRESARAYRRGQARQDHWSGVERED
jgi:hypothetical protein